MTATTSTSLSSTAISRTPLSEHIGVELHGVDLDQELTDQVRQELHDAWVEHGLVLLRGALHSHGAHLRLSQVFGAMEPSATSFLNSVENPFLMELRQVPHNPRSRRYLVNGEHRVGFIGWHWDQAFMPTIVRGAVLRMVEPPAEGGSTGFIDGIAAYDRLPEETKQRVDGLEVVYEFNPAMEQNPGFPRDVVSLNEAPTARNFPPVVHPLVITQPETGRKVLKLSPTHVGYIIGLEQAESDALVAELADVLTEDRYAYYHQWATDDVVIWDNWRVTHSASGVPEGISRLGIRTTIAGDYEVGRYLDPTLDKDNPPDRFDD